MKFKLHSISLFVLLPFFLCTNSCKEKFECNPNNTVLIPQIMKDFFFFKEGTWWVYKNVKNNAFDSLWIRETSYRTERGGDGFGSKEKCFQNAKVIISDKKNSGLFFQISNTSTDGDRYHFSSFNEGKDVSFTFLSGELETTFNPRPYYIKKIDSICIQNKTYNDLIEVNSINLLYDKIINRIYGNHVGLIKYIDRDSNQWELFKYHINQ
jgi:hypothetical protein